MDISDTGDSNAQYYLVVREVRNVLGDQLKVGDLFRLPHRRLLFGRHPDNDLQVRSRFVSRIHCALEWSHSDRRYLIEDMRSRMGVVVNGVQIELGTRHTLNPGDLINLDGTVFQLEMTLEPTSWQDTET